MDTHLERFRPRHPDGRRPPGHHPFRRNGVFVSTSNGGSRHQHDKVRVAIIGVGNCASSFVQGVHYYRDADPERQVPGLMHVDLGGYHVRDIEFSAAFDIDADKVGKDLSEAIFAGQNNTLKFDTEVPKLNVPVQRGMTHDGLGKYLSQRITKAPGRDRRHRPGPQGHPHRRRRLLPAGRLRAGDQVVRRADPRGRLWLRQLHPGVHRPRGLLEQALQEGRPADRRRRHQVPGRRDDRAPRARPPVPRPRRQAAAHLPAQRGRQHGLLQHARARAPGVQEDLQDQRRHLDHGPRAARPRTSTSARRTTCRG